MERQYGGGFRGGPRQNSFAPVRVGEELEVTIEAVGEKGDGIAKKNGFVLFVPGVKEGQHVRIKVTKVLRKVGFAEVVDSSAAADDSQEEEPADDEPAVEEESVEEESTSEDSQDSENFGEDSSQDDSERE